MKVKSILLSFLALACLGATQISSAARSDNGTFKFYVNNMLDKPIRVWVRFADQNLLYGKRIKPFISNYVGKFQRTDWNTTNYFNVKIQYGPEQFDARLNCNIFTGKPFGTTATEDAYLNIVPAEGNKFKAVISRQPNNSTCTKTLE